MPTAQRLGLFLLLIACAPLIMAAGGGPCDVDRVFGSVFNDLNRNGIRDDDEPLLPGVTITVFGVFGPGLPVSTDADGFYLVNSGLGPLTLCLDLPPTWTQTSPPDMGCHFVFATCIGGLVPGGELALSRPTAVRLG